MNRFKWIFMIAVAGLTLLGVYNEFIQDDAFISFRYADMLAKGEGLVWNPGGRELPVEGYTNFLWTVIIAGLIRCGVDPVVGSMVLGVMFGAGTLIITGLLAYALLGNRWWSLAAVVLLGTNYSFSSYMTGGLETQMHAFLTVLLTWAVHRAAHAGSGRITAYAGISCICAAAVMTRPDAVLLCGVFIVYLVWLDIRGLDAGGRHRLVRLFALFVPGLSAGTAWLAWKSGFYGGILPNTFYVKATGGMVAGLLSGVKFLFVFLQTYWFFPVLLLVVAYARTIVTERRLLPLAAAVAVWCAYILKIGGGFMEFRLLVSVLPFIFILVVRALMAAGTVPGIVLGMSLVLGSAVHGVCYDSRFGIESVNALEGYLADDGGAWCAAGKRLRAFSGAGGNGGVTIAVSAAGAIPYYSGLSTIDMLGLNDRWTARNGIAISDHPGHVRISTLAYMREAGVNLVLGHPALRAEGDSLARLRELIEPLVSSGSIIARVLPDTGTVVELPLGNGRSLCMLYLVPDPVVDAVIRERDLNTYRVLR